MYEYGGHTYNPLAFPYSSRTKQVASVGPLLERKQGTQ